MNTAKNFLWVITILIVLILTLNIFFPRNDRDLAKIRERLTPPGYQGVIFRKSHGRCNHIFINNNDYDTSDISCVTEELFNSANIGDTFIKIPNSNSCRIRNKDTSILCNCYY